MPEPENANKQESEEEEGPLINSNVIRIQLQKPRHRKWELVTRNCSPGRVFPTIQLFDCEGNLLLETNDDNISVKSSDIIERTHLGKRCSKSLGATDFAKRPINFPIKKTNSVTGVYTRFYMRNSSKEEKSSTDDNADTPVYENNNTPLCQKGNLSAPTLYGRSLSSPVSLYSSGVDNSELENSSYKSSDNESCSTVPVYKYITGNAGTLLVCENEIKNNYRRRPLRRNSAAHQQPISRNNSGNRMSSFNSYYKSPTMSHVPSESRKESITRKLKKSASYHKPRCKTPAYIRRANTDSFKNKYIPSSDNGYKIIRNMSFLDIYLKSLPSRNKEPPAWLEEIVKNVKLRKNGKNGVNEKWRRGMILSNESLNIDPVLLYDDDIESAVENEIRRRLKKYHRVMSCSDYWTWKRESQPKELKRRYSEGASDDTSSSESVDEADRILMRLRRRIFQNKKRERRYSKPGCSGVGCVYVESSRQSTYTQPTPEQPRRKRSTLAQDEDNSGLHNSPSIDYTGSLSQDPYLKELAETCVDAEQDGLVTRAPPAMGASVGRHGRGSSSTTGATGGRRRAQSSGDLCAAPDVGSFRDSCSVAGSVSDAATWNSRSLPSHLDGRRRLPCGGCGRCGDCVSSSENNNYNYTRSFGRPPHRHHRKFSHQYGCKLAAGELDPVWKLQDPGCDQGYGSERSPEEEFPPAMPVEEDYEDQDMDLRQMYPFINDENTFTVRVEKDRRGLGLSVAGGADSNSTGGTSGLVRIRRLYPSQPAWSTGRLRAGDLLLAANGVSLAGLTTYEALEVLRTTPPVVELVVCRPGPELQGRISPTGGTPPAPPVRQLPMDPLNLHAPRPRAPAPTPPSLSPTHPPNNVSDYEEPNPVYDVKYGEFDIVMTKVNGSLGFTLRKEDHSALGHYVRALVREPALSDGRIQPGDRIVAVNDVPMSTMSHGEAVSFLRRCGPVARLRLYRDHCGTPPSPSAASPTTESDTTLITRPKPPLRQEAVNMLCDIAARKLTPDDGNGSCSPCVSPRRYKKPTRNNTGHSQNSDTMHPYSVICPSTTAENSDNEMSQTLSNQSTDTADTTYSLVPDRRPLRPTCFNGQLFDNSKPARPDFLDLGGPPTPVNNRKQRLHFSVAAHGYELNNLDNDLLDAPNVYQDMSQNGGPGYLSSHQNHHHQISSEMSNEPMSMPIELIANTDSEEGRFSHKNPAYQSAVVHPSNNNQNGGYESSKDDGFKKWKNVNLSPDNERKAKFEKEEPEKPKIVRYPDENRAPGTSEPRIITVELNRGWNSRLGFSVQCHPESGQSFISAIYSDSVAAKDGRLRQGDIILQVNDENITSMTTPQVIDLLRILRGSICITVLRQ